MKLIVGITGASGGAYAFHTLQALRAAGVEVHLVATRVGIDIAIHETGLPWDDFASLSHRCYSEYDMNAPIASGSFRHDGMAVIPCSVKTVGAIAGGISDNLVVRAADVCLKERFRLVLAVRETPLSSIHLENMLRISNAGGVIMPACPAFYGKPQTIEALLDFVAGKLLDMLGVPNQLYHRWEGEYQL